jgi:sn-glycerol 3-phosphate transport system substrate-binding protein
MRSSRFVLMTLLVTTLALGTFASAQQVVDFWHGMTGSRLAVLEQVVDGFNQRDPNMQINPVLMGTYEEGLARFLGAYPVGEEPPLIQIYEVGTQAMHDSGMIIPAYQIPGMLGEAWDFGQYVGPIVRYYSRDGNLWSWPFASSTAMLYYNADHFRAAGLDPDAPPTTWDQVHEYGLKLQEAGVVRDVIGFGWPDCSSSSSSRCTTSPTSTTTTVAPTTAPRSCGPPSSPTRCSPSGPRWRRTACGCTPAPSTPRTRASRPGR